MMLFTKKISTKLKSAILHLMAFALILFTAWVTPQIRNLDAKLNDVALQSIPTQSSSDIVLVDIDQKAINAAKSFPVSRRFISDALDSLANKNPSRVLVDILFVADGNAQEDQALANSFKQFKPGTVAIAGINSALKTGRPSPNLKFRNDAAIFNSIILPDSDGYYRRIGASNSTAEENGFANPARWLAGERGASSLIVDQSISPPNYPRYSLADFANGKGPDLTGKLVIVGQVSSLLGLPVHYPLYGSMDRVMYFALGADTLLSGHEKYELSSAQLISLLMVICFIAFLVAYRLINNKNIVAISMLASVSIVIANLIALYAFNISMNVIITLAAWKTAIFITAIYKYRFLDAAKEVMSGDLSPEEAWQWRLMKEHRDPFLLLGLNGLRRANKSAHTLSILDKAGDNIDRIQKLALNMKDKGLQTVELNLEGQKRTFKILQPFKKIPLFQLQDITSESLEIKRLSEVAVTDALTNCLNKAGFESALEEVEASDKDYSIFILDMNGFKAANDTFGHQAGDKILTECAKRFKSVIRNTDILARIGGDEFAVLIKNDLGTKELQLIKDNLENSLEGSMNIDGQDIPIGVAVGFAKRKDKQDSASLIAEADKAMYERKAYLKSSGKAVNRAA